MEAQEDLMEEADAVESQEEGKEVGGELVEERTEAEKAKGAASALKSAHYARRSHAQN